MLITIEFLCEEMCYLFDTICQSFNVENETCMIQVFKNLGKKLQHMFLWFRSNSSITQTLMIEHSWLRVKLIAASVELRRFSVHCFSLLFSFFHSFFRFIQFFISFKWKIPQPIYVCFHENQQLKFHNQFIHMTIPRRKKRRRK